VPDDGGQCPRSAPNQSSWWRASEASTPSSHRTTAHRYGYTSLGSPAYTTSGMATGKPAARQASHLSVLLALSHRGGRPITDSPATALRSARQKLGGLTGHKPTRLRAVAVANLTDVARKGTNDLLLGPASQQGGKISFPAQGATGARCRR
jgi:hypothetical protein